MAKNYTTVPNQLTVTIGPRVKCDNNFIQIKKEAFYKAVKTFTKEKTVLLYLYLVGNAPGYEFALSPKVIEKDLGVKLGAYRSARDELIDLGYLIETSSNHYTFIECPWLEKTSSYSQNTTNRFNYVVLTEDDIDKISKAEKAWSCSQNMTTQCSQNMTVVLTENDGHIERKGEIDNKQIDNKIDIDTLPIISRMDLDRVRGHYKDLGNGVIEVPSGKRFRLPE